MTWVNIREKLSKEEIVEVASKDAITSTPIDNVVFDGKEIKRLIRKIDPSTKPKKKRRENPQDGSLRDFVSDDERKMYIDEFGPYGMALINDYEREYFRTRRDQILNEGNFDLDPEFDMSIVMMVVMDEIIQQRFLQEMASNPTNQALNKQLTEIYKRYRENLKTLDATREQRNASGDRENLDSLAQAVLMLHRNKEQRLKEMVEYQKEEEELLKKIALKAPPEVDYWDTEEITPPSDTDED
jgi:hypothetical protein